MKNDYSITISKDELDARYIKLYQRDAEYKTGVSGMADIANDLGECLGHGTYDDAGWYFDAICEAENYAHEQFNFEDAVLGMADKELLLMADKHAPEHVVRMIAAETEDGGVHTLAAAYALHDPDGFTELVREVKDMDRDVLTDIFPEYAKDRQDAADSTADDMRKEFIRGDYRGNFNGIEKDLAKQYGCEGADVQGYDAVSFSWESREQCKAELDEKTDGLPGPGAKAFDVAVKKYIVDDLCSDAYRHKEKRRAENAAARVERERLAKYQAERKEREDAERRAKIDAIRK